MEYYNFPNSRKDQIIMQIHKLKEDMKTEKSILERFATKILIFILEIKINRTKRIATDMVALIAGFFALVFAPLGFLLYTIIFHICMQMEGVYYELNLDDTTGFFFFLIEITFVYLIGYYTSAYVFVAAYIVVHICIILLKEVVVFGYFSS